MSIIALTAFIALSVNNINSVAIPSVAGFGPHIKFIHTDSHNQQVAGFGPHIKFIQTDNHNQQIAGFGPHIKFSNQLTA